ncbi:MAG TPA: hypothetical protein VFE32_12070 [Puia sp.]|jgi:hypothetical protein|nr:hypothetical protein [Puia sp.]
MAKAKKKAATNSEPLKLNMSFEEAIRCSIQTKVPKKKKAVKKAKK